MTNYLDEYNKRMTYGKAMGFDPSPLAQTAHMHADRDRQMQQQQPGVGAGEGYDVSLGNADGKAGLFRALLILSGGVALMAVSVLAIEKADGIVQVLGMIGAFTGFVISAFGAVATFLTGLITIGTIIRQKIFWAIAAVSGLSAFALSMGTAINVFVVLMLGWGAVAGGRKLLARPTPASVKDSQ